MTTPDIILCPDRYFRRVIYGPGPHIGDYPEQAVLAWILFGWCPGWVTYLLISIMSAYSYLNSFQVALVFLIHSMPHVATGLQPTPTFCLGCMMKTPYESRTALRLVLWCVFNVTRVILY